jgi:mannose-6-phosphate isomerase-like protein (cupin superfamily)
MAGNVVSLAERSAALTEPWRPMDLVEANGAILRLGRFDGEFVWHHHDEDELFLCWSGEFIVELAGGTAVRLKPGDIFVVPAGTEHRPVAKEGPAYGLMIERPETLQYGNQPDASA